MTTETTLRFDDAVPDRNRPAPWLSVQSFHVARQISFLSGNRFRAIAPDLRGFGPTKASSEITTMEDMARDVAALMNELKIDQAVICGLSMGGYVTFEFARLFRDRVKALVLAERAPPADNDQEKKAREEQASRMLAEGMKAGAERRYQNCLPQRHWLRNPTSWRKCER